MGTADEERIPPKTLRELWICVLYELDLTSNFCPADPFSISCPRAESRLFLETQLGELVFSFLHADDLHERLLTELECPHLEITRKVVAGRKRIGRDRYLASG